MFAAATLRTEPQAVLRDAVQCAVLAPSSHNTQPWTFRIGSDRLELYADRTRGLPVNDPNHRELTISCGAALLNARIAAQHAGAKLDVDVLPEGDEADLLARATLAGHASPDERLFAAIADRRTYRQAFADRDVSGETVAQLVRVAAAEGAWLQVLGAEQRARFVALVAEGDCMQFADVRWRRELASWMRPRRKGDGLVLPELVAPVTRFVVRHFDVGKRTADKDAKLAERSPLLAVLATTGDTPADWLCAGQALQRLLLTATAAGLQASHLNQPIQREQLRPQTSQLLNRPGFAQVAIRLGHPLETLPPAPRRPIEAVIAQS